MLQTSIDERCNVIARIIDEVPKLIHIQFSLYEHEAELLATKNCDADSEIYETVYNNTLNSFRHEDELWMIEETYRSMVLLIASFAETTIKGLLKNPNIKFKRSTEKYIYQVYDQVRKESLFNLEDIEYYWKDCSGFFDLRNAIAHDHELVQVERSYLFDALFGAHSLLRAIADELDSKVRLTNKM